MRSYSVDKPIIIKAHAVKYFTNPRPDQPFPKPHYPSPRTNLSKTALSHPLFVWQSSVCAYTVLHLNYPTHFSYRIRLFVLICFYICTITHAFRRGVGLPLPLLRPSPSTQSLQKDNNPSLRTNPSKTALSLAPHHHTCLPCQREVDWRQGTNLNIIAFTCDMLTIFILQTFLPSRRRDCHTTIPRPAPTLPKPHYPIHFS